MGLDEETEIIHEDEPSKTMKVVYTVTETVGMPACQICILRINNHALIRCQQGGPKSYYYQTCKLSCINNHALIRCQQWGPKSYYSQTCKLSCINNHALIRCQQWEPKSYYC